ncbi:hypothetical protein [Leptospira congkakensis]|nr:hypothetical protein [Leptospira congkakensis]
MELTLDDKKWFRFSPEGTAANPNSNNPTPVHFFFIQKEADTEISWVTSTTCITSPSYTYERTPISATQTEIKYNLWNSDFYFSNRTTSTYQNGYYIKLISGNPKITIRFE